MLSLAVLIKKGEYGNAIRCGVPIVAGILSAQAGLASPESPHLFVLLRRLSIVPLVIAIGFTLPVVRRAWELLRRSGAS